MADLYGDAELLFVGIPFLLFCLDGPKKLTLLLNRAASDQRNPIRVQ